MDLFTGIFIAWGVGFSSYILLKFKGKNKYKVEYFDLSDRIIKNKRQKDNINQRVKGMFGK